MERERTPPALLVVGSYASADEPGIHAFRMHGDGRLTPLGATGGVARPSYVIPHPARNVLYAVGELDRTEHGVAGRVWALAIERDPWMLRPLNDLPSGGDLPCHLRLDPTGGWLVVSNYGSGTVGLLRLAADGSLAEMTATVQHQGRSVRRGRQDGPHAHSAVVTPDGRLVLVADLGTDRIVSYQLERGTGALVPHGETTARPGAGPRHMAFDPTGRRLYVTNELDSTVSLYEFTPTSGALSEAQVVATLPGAVDGNLVADIALSRSGDRLYVSNRGHDSIAVFGVSPGGRLERTAIRPCGGAWPRSIALDPAGGHLVVANQRGDGVAVLAVRAESPDLAEALPAAAVPRPSSVRFLPARA